MHSKATKSLQHSVLNGCAAIYFWSSPP